VLREHSAVPKAEVMPGNESNEAALFFAWTSNAGRRRQLSSLKIRSIESHLSPGGVPGKAC